MVRICGGGAGLRYGRRMGITAGAEWAVHLPHRSETGGRPWPVAPPGGTLPQAWAGRFDEAPDRRLLWEERRGWVRAGDLDQASRRVAARLAAAGLRPGDRIPPSAPPPVHRWACP